MDLIDKFEIVKGRGKINISINNMGIVSLKYSKDVNKSTIEKFVENKKQWILKKKTEKLDAIEKNKQILNYEKVFIFEKEYKLEKSKKNEVIDNVIYYSNIKYLVTNIQKIANDEFLSLADECKKIVGVKPNNIIFDNSKRRWGVCTSKKDIKINFRTTMIPKELCKYVIIHELCHLIHFNHSQFFWLEVEHFYPNYKIAKQQIKEYAFLLDIYR